MDVLATLLVLLLAPPPGQSVPELFQKMKEEVKAEKWNDALVTMEVIDVEAAKPENAKLQAQLEGPLAFYRGVCDANAGNADKAQADFEAFLRTKPDAGIDDKMYSKKAVAAFAAAQKAIASAGPSLARAYTEFKPPENIREPASPTWGDGPVVWLMTDSEKSAWAAATTDADRAAYVEKFWKARNLEDDPSFQANFEKRVAFADANFAADDKSKKKRGSMTDRGMVFVLLGPPTYGGRRRLKAGEDKNQNAGMSSVGDHDSFIAQKQLIAKGATTTSQLAALNDHYVGPGTEAAQNSIDFQEVWHYRKELLPKNVSYLQVDATFITKKGYGVEVLQRESDILTTLSAAKQKPQ
ncbi:MAG TPA: GWxTD domain-containing protein [Thermoanaerobaculia bacterium]|nr:GWxTD domain-containing protein [Thermoanaerobaculia bacterium]